MKYVRLANPLIISMALAFLAACGGEKPVDVKAVLSQSKSYVGSNTCKMCHLEHYDSWQMTMHPRMIQDVQKNRDVVVPDWNPDAIRAEIAKLGDKLKVPADKLYIPKIEEIKYTIGGQRTQYYLVERNGDLFRAPVGYDVVEEKWGPSNEAEWDKVPWKKTCAGCHVTGMNLETNSFVEPGVGCEACHGPGSHHVALPKTQVFDKRATIVNPAKLPMRAAVQICGSCHNAGKSLKKQGIEWAYGYLPGMQLGSLYRTPTYAEGDKFHFYPNEYSRFSHQQYVDWKKSAHAQEGVTCTSCHYVHQIGIAATGSQTKSSGSQQCMSCHTQVNTNMAHAIHSFANCIGCHMPRIAHGVRSHVFLPILPSVTVADPKMPNSCQACHKHRNEDPKELQARFDSLAKFPKPAGKSMDTISHK